MASETGLLPVIINLAGQTRINEVVWADENVESFEQLAASFYTSLRHNIPEFYLESGERTITKMWVEWNQGGGNFLPMETEIHEGNLRAVLRILAMRRGVDMIRVWLNEID
ncbi:hypothetical protein N7474_001084 [Penicillium riverlandense]|uniref:uncharacterized protein n=1 Tax=Penicillium riverlandense TaxID=1903569 RepID=UPI0025472873|nr:uncharacterized protein N7474_001084 [Penicillium riverlandense]KAJ5832773.1 hypothetical protein N7474_001084 [Penicillium riverlandense]